MPMPSRNAWPSKRRSWRPTLASLSSQFIDLAAADLSRPVEHFGYRDRISVVQIEGTGLEPTPGKLPRQQAG